jgi:hypothetical protein
MGEGWRRKKIRNDEIGNRESDRDRQANRLDSNWDVGLD